MRSEAKTITEYIESLGPERKEVIQELHQTIKSHLPKGFEPEMNYGMIGYVVPHSLYPSGYHCDPVMPLPFMNVASQKNFVVVYNMGLSADKGLLDWFEKEWPKHTSMKLDMGKSCIRMKKLDDVPYNLIGQLCTKKTVQDWIDIYESVIKR